MSEEKKISRKTLKIILGVCIGAMAALTVGFFAYIHIADTNTLGRKISIYGLDVSRLSTADAKQKILTAFQNKKIVFQENGQEVYSLTLKDMGYSLDESDLEVQLTELQKKREANRKIFAKQENVNISYKVNRNTEQEKQPLLQSILETENVPLPQMHRFSTMTRKENLHLPVKVRVMRLMKADF